MKKIKLTESQLRYCLEHLNELNNMGAGIQVAAKTDSSGKVTQQTLTDQGRELTTQGMGDAQIVVDQDTINEEDEVFDRDNSGISVEDAASIVLSDHYGDVYFSNTPRKIINIIARVLSDKINPNMNEADKMKFFKDVMNKMLEIIYNDDKERLGEKMPYTFEPINEENTQNGGDSELMNIINNEVDPYYVAEKLIDYNDGNFNPIFRYWDEACDYIKEIVWDEVLYNRDDDFYNAHVDDIENNPKFLNPFYDKVYKVVKEYYDNWGPSVQDEIEDREDAEEFKADARREEGGMWEGKVITKKQLREAYINKIIKEAKAVYRKKDLK